MARVFLLNKDQTEVKYFCSKTRYKARSKILFIFCFAAFLHGHSLAFG